MTDEEKNEKIYQKMRLWLSSEIGYRPEELDGLMKKQSATLFLFIWPIFEQKVFKGEFKKRLISQAAEAYSDYSDELCLETPVKHFQYRYQDKPELYQALKNSDHFPDYDHVPGIRFEELSPKEGIGFLIYIISRYRNNIFHGTKGIKRWSDYTDEIEMCLEFMEAMIECQKKHGINLQHEHHNNRRIHNAN